MGLAGSSLEVGAALLLVFWWQLGYSLGDMARPPALQLKILPQTPRVNHGQLRNTPAGEAGLNSCILGVTLPITQLRSQEASVVCSNPLGARGTTQERQPEQGILGTKCSSYVEMLWGPETLSSTATPCRTHAGRGARADSTGLGHTLFQGRKFPMSFPYYFEL